MQLKNNLLVCFALAMFVVLAMIDTVTAGEGKGKGKGKGWGGGKNMTCKGEPMPKSKLMDYGKDCWKEMKGDSKSGSTTSSEDDDSGAEGEDEGDASKKGIGAKTKGKMLCMSVCVMKKQSILGADGKYNMAGAESYIKSAYPASVQADMKKGLDECASANGASFSMDNDCEGYKKFKGCQWKNMMAVCGWSGKGKGGGKGKNKGGATEASDDV